MVNSKEPVDGTWVPQEEHDVIRICEAHKLPPIASLNSAVHQVPVRFNQEGLYSQNIQKGGQAVPLPNPRINVNGVGHHRTAPNLTSTPRHKRLNPRPETVGEAKGLQDRKKVAVGDIVKSLILVHRVDEPIHPTLCLEKVPNTFDVSPYGPSPYGTGLVEPHYVPKDPLQPPARIFVRIL